MLTSTVIAMWIPPLSCLSELPAGFRAATARIAASEPATAAGGLRTRFVDGQATAAELMTVQVGDGLLGVSVGAHFDECESARTSGFAINRHHHVRGFGDRCEVSSEICFGRAVGEVPYEETDSHYASVRRRDSISGLRQTPNTV